MSVIHWDACVAIDENRHCDKRSSFFCFISFQATCDNKLLLQYIETDRNKHRAFFSFLYCRIRDFK